MRICDFQSSLAQLKEASQKLSEQWADTQTAWNDAKAAEFEKDHLQPVEPILSWTVAAVNHINDVMQKAEHDLESERM